MATKNPNVRDIVRMLRNAEEDDDGVLFLEEVPALVGNVRKWCQPLVNEHTAVVSDAEFELEDEDGHYMLDGLRITLGRRAVQLKPIASHVVGALGRVDVVGPRKSRMLVLKGKDDWRLVSELRGSPLKPLDQMVFLRLLLDVAPPTISVSRVGPKKGKP